MKESQLRRLVREELLREGSDRDLEKFIKGLRRIAKNIKGSNVESKVLIHYLNDAAKRLEDMSEKIEDLYEELAGEDW